MDPASNFKFHPDSIMKKAIDLALKAQFKTDPNPMVGAVLVNPSGKILSEGYHHKAGAPHAEVEALKSFDTVPQDAILFVTLEPCNFYGKTPPCTELILKKKVKTVVVGCSDPNPKVAGKGMAFLKENGVNVFAGVCEKECIELNRVFNKHIVSQLPYVTIKAAMSIDGKISMPSGESQWITGEEARKIGHRLRSQNQAMAVGAKTLKQDNPRLTDRISDTPSDPKRVVFSSDGVIPMASHFVSCCDTERYLIAGNSILSATEKALVNNGIQVFVDDQVKPGIQFGLKALYNAGICSLLVEGGAELIASFIKEKMIDQYYLFIAGKIIGSQKAPSWSGNIGIEKLADVPHLTFDRFEKIGEDLLITGYPQQS